MSNGAESTRGRLLAAAEKFVMANGFAGTTIDDILKETGLTKGAFFHYFKGKADLARALIEAHALRDIAMFERFAREAEARTDDPLEQTYLFLEFFEKETSNAPDDGSPGCIYAAYTYESMQFDPSIRDFVADTLRKWTGIYARKFQEVLDLYEPAIPVTARQLAELTIAVLEGGLVMQRAYNDRHWTARQSEQFRNYLMLLFGRPGKGKSGKTAAKPAKRKTAAKEPA